MGRSLRRRAERPLFPLRALMAYNSRRYVALARKHRVNGWKEIGCNSALENKAIRTRRQGRFACARLVRHANDDHFHFRTTHAKPFYHSNSIAMRQRKIDDG